MMRVINYSIEASCENFHVSGTIEVDDDFTDEQIEAAVSEEVFSIVQWGWAAQGGDDAG
jgi:hypothetical protein